MRCHVCMDSKKQNVITGTLGLLLIASVVGNAYLYQKSQANEGVADVPHATTWSATFEGPGLKNEVVTLFDGRSYRTYATSTPLSESDIRAMREKVERDFECMNEFFKRRDELFRELWGF